MIQNSYALENLVQSIISRANEGTMHMVISNEEYESLLLFDGLNRLTQELIAKCSLPVRVWAKSAGQLKLKHLITKESAEIIIREGFLFNSLSNFPEDMLGVYCVKADCDSGDRALEYVKTDHCGLDCLLQLTYQGQYYMVVNHPEAYVFIIDTKGILDVKRV